MALSLGMRVRGRSPHLEPGAPRYIRPWRYARTSGVEWRCSHRIGVLLCAFLALAVASGCGSSDELPPPTDPSMLRGIVRVYGIATRDLGRPPENIDELKAVYAQVDSDPSKYVRSTRDGEEFVVVWGLRMEGMSPDTVVAYERKGAGGTRMVISADGAVREVSAEEFVKLKFPKNHTPDT